MEVRLGHVLDSVPAMVWSALPDGTIDYLNRRWFTYTGIRATQAEQWDWKAVIHPEDIRDFIDSWRSVFSSRNAGHVKCRVRRSDGEYRWFAINCSPEHDDAGCLARWYAVAEDVEDLRRAETTVRSRERDLEEVFNSIPMQAALLHPSGEVKRVNQTALDFFGKTLGALEDWKNAGVFHPDDLGQITVAQRDAHEKGNVFNVECRCRRADGVYRWFNVLGVPLRSSQDVVLRWLYLLIDAEDRKRAEAVLRESDQRFRLVVDCIPGMVAVFAPDGTLEFVNQQVLEYFGATLEELRHWGTGGFVHPEDLPATIEVFERSLASGEPFEIELRTRRFDGTYRWVQTRGSPLKDDSGRPIRWFNLLTDIDARKRAEEVLATSQRDLQLTIDTIPAVVWSARPDGWADFFSQHYLDYVGFPFEKALGWGWTEAIHPDDLPKLLATWQAVASSGKAGDAEARIRRHDGVYRRFLFRANPLHDEHGNVVKWYGVNTDIEDRHLSEETLEKVRSELAQVTRVMSLGVLTASIAHEVNQPLSGIITNAGTCLRMLSTKPPDIKGARETARRTIRDGNRAADVIGRLRSLFSKKISLHESVNLNEAAREVLALMAGDLRRARVALRTNFEEGLPPILADRIQIQQVIMNLLRNAAEAMSDIDYGQRELLLRTQFISNRDAQLSIRDVGVGFGNEEPGKVFEPFYTTKHAGMGIGLSVSRSIIERHSGRIWAEANDGSGATFSFCVPIYEREEPDAGIDELVSTHHAVGESADRS